jgi:hypothetical protein
MKYPSIAFSLDSQTTSLPSQGFSQLANQDLQSLLDQSNDLSASLAHEIEKRQLTTHLVGVEEQIQRLHKTAKNLGILQRLDRRSLRYVNTAVQTMKLPQENKAFKVYSDFLSDVLRHSSPGMVLICAVGLGKQRTANMTAKDRVGLIQYIIEKKDWLSSSALDTLARAHAIPEGVLHSPKPSRNDEALARRRKHDFFLTGFLTHL